MGDYAGRAPIEIFMDGKRDGGEAPSPGKADLIGKRLVIASEIMQSRRFNESFIKDVTGGDQIKAAHKFQRPFTFKPQLKLWLYGNHKPIVTGGDDGIKSRLPLIPFMVTIPPDERDPDLDKKLRDEAEGILLWAVLGCLEWQQKRLSPPASVIQASDSYHQSMDVLAVFFSSCLVFEAKAVATNQEITFAFDEWAKGEGIDERSRPKPTDRADRLKREGCDNFGGKSVRHNGKVQRCWQNVRLRTFEDADDIAECNGVTGVTTKTARLPNSALMGEVTESAVTPVTPVTNPENPPDLFVGEDPFGEDEESEFPEPEFEEDVF